MIALNFNNDHVSKCKGIHCLHQQGASESLDIAHQKPIGLSQRGSNKVVFMRDESRENNPIAEG